MKLDGLKIANQIAKERNGKCLSTIYEKSIAPLRWLCNVCGHNWAAKLHDVKDGGHWCPKCAGQLKRTIEECKQLAEDRDGKCLSETYKNNKSPLEWQCSFGHRWSSRPDHVIQGSWCPKCAGIVPLTIEECRLFAQSKGGDCLSKTYHGARFKLEWQCAQKHSWPAAPNNIMNQEQWCPHCPVYKAQKLLTSVLVELFPSYEVLTNFRGFDWLSTCKNGKLELDIYIPELKLAIEYDGEQHFRSVDFFGGMEAFKNTCRRDKLKNERVAEHPEDVATFIRIKYTLSLSKDNVRRILKEHAIIVPE